MSQSSFPASASLGSSATVPWFSDETLKRSIPGFRAVVDGLLISFGALLALIHLPAAKGLFEENNGWKLSFFLTSNLAVGLLGIVIAYFTARSSYWRDRQRVLVCLSLALLLYAGMSSLGLWIQEYPEALRYLLLCVSATAGATLTCIGLISVEKRLCSANRGGEIPERVANNFQCLLRVFYGCLFGVLTIVCLVMPFACVYGIYNGSFAECFEKAYNCQISGFNFFCITTLTLFSSLNHLMLAFISWLYLQYFHQRISPSFKEKFPPVYRPAITAIFVCVVGSFIHIFSLLLFHSSPDIAPWMLLATIFCAWAGYKRCAAKTAIELKRNAVA